MAGRIVATLAVSSLLMGVGMALAANGAASVLPNESTAQGRQAQEPIGTLSARAPGDQTLGNQEQGGGNTTLGSGGGATPGGSGNNSVAGLEESGSNSAGGGGSGGSGSLPFTGFLAIPLLAAGGALLLVGGALRRRAAQAG
jgi:hypothetical protein